MKSGIVILFGLTSFLAAALLFSVQPMIGKMVLPVLGGTPAVWNTCLVFFQVTLLCGYLLAHGDESLPKATELRRVACRLPVCAGDAAGIRLLNPADRDPARRIGGTRSIDNPAIGLLGFLRISATLPLVMVSATAPLLQCWFALTAHPRARDPFFLYAASNAGSLLALLAYPFVDRAEPGSEPRRAGSGGRAFLVLAILVLTCGVLARNLEPTARLIERQARKSQPSKRESPRRYWLRWIVLVFIPSSWLMGVTTYLTTDLAAIPLLWVIPLAIYLLSFILAFARSGARVVRVATRLLPYLIAPLVLVMSAGFAHAVWIPLHLARVFRRLRRVPRCACCSCGRRPRRASTFYVTIAVGGLTGRRSSTRLDRSLVFNRVVEYPLAMVLACLVAPGVEAAPCGTKLFEGIGWATCSFPASCFCLTVILATNQAGLAESLTGRAGRDDRLGPGNSRVRDGQAPADAVCIDGRRGPGGQRPVAAASTAACSTSSAASLASCA